MSVPTLFRTQAIFAAAFRTVNKRRWTARANLQPQSAWIAGHQGRRAFSASAAARLHVPVTQDILTAPATSLDASTAALHAVEASTGPFSKFLASSAEIVLALPSLSSSLSYTSVIVLLTLVLRSSITLPVTLWQRRRIQRVALKVIPEVKKWQEQAKYQLRAEFRRAGKNYEEYVAVLTRMVSACLAEALSSF